MNKSWSELNRKMQIQLKKEATFADGIETLFELRKELMQAAVRFSSGKLQGTHKPPDYHNRKRTCKTADCRIFTTAESWRGSKLHPRSQSPN